MRDRSLTGDILADKIKDIVMSSDTEPGDVVECIKKEIPEISHELAQKVAMLSEALLAKKEQDEVEIVVTAPVSFKVHNRKTRPVMEELIKSAKKSITITGYSISEHFSELLQLVNLKSNQGVLVELFINDYDKAKDIFSGFEHKGRKFLKLYDYRGREGDKMAALHAKTIIVDKEKVLISSANLSYHGLDRNIEIGSLITSKQKASQILAVLSELVRQKIFGIVN